MMIGLSLRRQETAVTVATRQPTISLASEQVAFYNAEGYLRIPALTTPEEVAFIRRIYDMAFEGKVGFETGDFFDFAGQDDGDQQKFPQMFGMSNYFPELRETLFWANATQVARQLLGPSAKFVFEHALRKPPGGPRTPWHQDHAFYPKGTRHETLTIWMPLQDVDRDNGCMEFVPRSHLGKLYEHRSMDNDPKVHAIEAIGVDQNWAVPCALPAGGASVHHRMTLHYAAPNLTDEPRRAYALMFAVKLDHIIIRETLPWLAGKATARDQREYASLTPWKRVKRVGRKALGSLGIYPN